MTSDIGVGGTVGGYGLESLLGRGGMSVVYLAEDSKLGRKVALKVMSEELSENEAFRTRFIREAKMAANLEHPSIVPVYDAGDADGVLYLAMRVIRGTDLRRVITDEGPLDAERTMAVMRQVASALDAAHRAGLVHRDVKPANILLSTVGDDEHAYLSDFGLTKHVSSKSGLTKTGQFMGTIDYVAPEQIRGTEVDGRTDVYSLGCVLYECLTGRVPFTKDQDVAILFAHLEDPAPRVTAVRPDLPASLDDVLARAMAKEREERFDTCMAFVQAARQALVMAPAGNPALTVAPPPPTLIAEPPGPAEASAVEVEERLEPHPSFPPQDDAPIAAAIGTGLDAPPDLAPATSPPATTPPAVQPATTPPDIGPATTPPDVGTTIPSPDLVPPTPSPDLALPTAPDDVALATTPPATAPPTQPEIDVPAPPPSAAPSAPLRRPSAAAPPVRTPDRIGRAPEARRRTLLGAVVALLVVAAAVAAFVLAGGDEETVATPTGPPSPTEAPSPTETPSPSPDVEVPPAVRAPITVRTTDVTPSSVALEWRGAPNGGDAVRFLILRNGRQIAKTTKTSFVDRTAAASTSYVYRIVAVGDDGSQARSKPLEVTTPAPAPPSSSGGGGGGGGGGCDGIIIGTDCV